MSEQWRPKRIAIIGVGLLGGSVGLAARRAWADVAVVGFSQRQATLAHALASGVITEVANDLVGAVQRADLICVSTPVNLISQQIIAAATNSPDEAIVTDVGSTKAGIVKRASLDPTAQQKFVAGHPIAGGEKTGPAFSRSDLFDGRWVVLTPTQVSDPQRVSRLSSFWQACGAKVVVMEPEKHDEILAASSHLPHLVAAALASIIPNEAISLAGTGWRDTTRVAAGCPDMWSAICAENKIHICNQISNMVSQLEELKTAIKDGKLDWVRTFLADAREKRERVTGEV